MSNSLRPVACLASLPFTISWNLLKLKSIELVMPSNHLILRHPLLLPPSIFPSIRVFSNESVLCIRWPKYWSFSFNISPSNEHRRLTFFRMDWLDLLAVQGTLKSLLQHLLHLADSKSSCRSQTFLDTHIFQQGNLSPHPLHHQHSSHWALHL